MLKSIGKHRTEHNNQKANLHFKYTEPTHISSTHSYLKNCIANGDNRQSMYIRL